MRALRSVPHRVRQVSRHGRGLCPCCNPAVTFSSASSPPHSSSSSLSSSSSKVPHSSVGQNLSVDATPTTHPGPSVSYPFDNKKTSSSNYVVPNHTLRGSCDCGDVGFIATGPSSLNFVCHCKYCREHSKLPATKASAFLPRQVTWINPDGIRRTKAPPSGDGNETGPHSSRCHCKKCNGYIGDEALDSMGVVKLPLSAAENYRTLQSKKGLPVPASVDELYQPNHHIFYKERVADVNDLLPKWVSFPEGILAVSNSSSMLTPGSSTVEMFDMNSYSQYNPDSGRFRKDVMPMSPTRAQIPSTYFYTETDLL